MQLASDHTLKVRARLRMVNTHMLAVKKQMPLGTHHRPEETPPSLLGLIKLSSDNITQETILRPFSLWVMAQEMETHFDMIFSA